MLKQVAIRYTSYGELQEGDEFIRVAGMPVLLRDLDGERQGGQFVPSAFGMGRGKENRGYEIRRMDAGPNGSLREVFLSTTINVLRDFSKYPGGRYPTDGDHSGQALREDLLEPALRRYETVVVELDGTLGYGSSVLEEGFGGLVRVSGFTAEHLHRALELRTENAELASTIWHYVDEAQAVKDEALRERSRYAARTE